MGGPGSGGPLLAVLREHLRLGISQDAHHVLPGVRPRLDQLDALLVEILALGIGESLGFAADGHGPPARVNSSIPTGPQPRPGSRIRRTSPIPPRPCLQRNPDALILSLPRCGAAAPRTPPRVGSTAPSRSCPAPGPGCGGPSPGAPAAWPGAVARLRAHPLSSGACASVWFSTPTL